MKFNKSMYRKFVRYMSVITPFLLIVSFGCDKVEETEEPATIGTDWTIMIYADGDNDLEEYLLTDIEEMKNGYVNNQGHNVIVLADRTDNYTNSISGFGENFASTRLYRIINGAAERISGGSQFPEIEGASPDQLDYPGTRSGQEYEANMGDADTLKKFIKYCKENFPATRYGLVLWNHGVGSQKKKSTNQTYHAKIICEDETSEDFLYTAEITDVLTPDESVDLLAFDACLMGSVEVAYQYRPGNNDFNASIMVASAPEVWGFGYRYDKILARISSGGGGNGEIDTITGSGSGESYYDPKTMTALELGRIIVEEQYDSIQEYGDQVTDQSMSCYDLAYIDEVKSALDALAASLAVNNEKADLETVRGSGSSPQTMHYFDGSDAESWITAPLFDVYDLCRRIKYEKDGSNFHNNIIGSNGLTNKVLEAVDDLIIYSFGGPKYTGFTNGLNGIQLFCPDGDRIYNGNIHWDYQWWYNAIDTTLGGLNPDYLYGKLAWCIDDAVSGNNTVENWFEMLDSFFDTYKNLNNYDW